MIWVKHKPSQKPLDGWEFYRVHTHMHCIFSYNNNNDSNFYYNKNEIKIINQWPFTKPIQHVCNILLQNIFLIMLSIFFTDMTVI